MLIAGCFVTFFTSHQRIFVEAVRMDGSCRVTVAGLANKNKYGMKQEVKRIAKNLAAKS
jgi:cytochrome c biogenesis protein